MEFEFQGEEGTGLGPTLEFYDDIAEQIKTWTLEIGKESKFNMWRMTKDNHLFPSPVCLISFPPDKIKQIYEMFRMCGTIVAKAIVDDRQIDMPISPLFWKLCLGDKLTIFDLRTIDEAVFGTVAEFQSVCNKLHEIEEKLFKEEDQELKRRQVAAIKLKNGSRVEDYCLDFTLPCYSNIELVPNGKDQEVSITNAQDYVDLVLHYTFHETIKLQVQAFKKGFNSIFPISSLSPFLHASSSEEEIEKIVCGTRCANWGDTEQLKKFINPDHGLTRNSSVYQWFIKYMVELDDSEKQQFIKFLIGSKRLPLGGFKNLQPNLTIVLKKPVGSQSADQILPSVMAC
jgi:E3 ubiquitin-protein ligase TRIP12